MTTSSESITLCNDALILVGGNIINDFDDGTDEALIASSLYEDIYKTILVESPWTFNTTQDTLNRQVDVPAWKFQYAHQLPSGFINLIDISTSENYDIYKDNLLYTDDIGPIDIEYQFRVAEEKLPPHIRMYIKLKLASLFAIPIAEDAVKADKYDKAADTARKLAGRIDAQQRKNRGFKSFPLIKARG